MIPERTTRDRPGLNGRFGAQHPVTVLAVTVLGVVAYEALLGFASSSLPYASMPGALSAWNGSATVRVAIGFTLLNLVGAAAAAIPVAWLLDSILGPAARWPAVAVGIVVAIMLLVEASADLHGGHRVLAGGVTAIQGLAVACGVSASRALFRARRRHSPRPVASGAHHGEDPCES